MPPTRFLPAVAVLALSLSACGNETRIVSRIPPSSTGGAESTGPTSSAASVTATAAPDAAAPAASTPQTTAQSAENGVTSIPPSSPTSTTAATTPALPTPTGPPVVARPTPAVTLRLGDSGTDVSRLQQELMDRGYDLEVDGRFGPATDRALRAAQADMSIVDDGLVGPRTRAALGIGDNTASIYRTTNDFMDAFVGALNGTSTQPLPLDATTALPPSPAPSIRWEWGPHNEEIGGRMLSSITQTFEGGVSAFGLVCTRLDTNGMVHWCGTWSLSAH